MKTRIILTFMIGIALALPLAAEEEEKYDIEESPSESPANKENSNRTPSSSAKTTPKLKTYQTPQKCPLGECDPYGDEDEGDCDDFIGNTHHCFWEDENESNDLFYRDGELDADWPGKRTDPFFDNLTR